MIPHSSMHETRCEKFCSRISDYKYNVCCMYIVTRGDRFVGNMMGGSDMESSMGSEDSDSDLDLADDLQSDDDETIVKLTGEGSSNKTKYHSDEDF